MRGSILVEMRLDRMGCLTGRPVADRWAFRFAALCFSNGGPADPSFFFQGDNVREILEADIPARARVELEKGWLVRVRLDAWMVGHWYGYDAHLASEAPWGEIVAHDRDTMRAAMRAVRAAA